MSVLLASPPSQPETRLRNPPSASRHRRTWMELILVLAALPCSHVFVLVRCLSVASMLLCLARAPPLALRYSARGTRRALDASVQELLLALPAFLRMVLAHLLLRSRAVMRIAI
jgi:hypothetical protein